LNYEKLKLGDKEFFTARPETWAELSFTLLNEKPFLNYNPNIVEVKNPDLLNMFL
jgi:hypothetical protein|tara:strand:- start:1182 stop:1346 length:165 start_codon:yes stop_codon:yes gene_type:complete